MYQGLNCVLQRPPRILGLNRKNSWYQLFARNFVIKEHGKEFSSIKVDVYLECVLDAQHILPKLRCILKGHSLRKHWDGVFSSIKIPPTDFLPLKELTCLPHFKRNHPSRKSSCFSAVAFPRISVGVQLHTWNVYTGGQHIAHPVYSQNPCRQAGLASNRATAE